MKPNSSVPPTDLRLTIGRNLRAQMALAGVSNAELAARTGLSLATIGNVLAGKTTTIMTIDRVATALGTSVSVVSQPYSGLGSPAQDVPIPAISDTVAAK